MVKNAKLISLFLLLALSAGCGRSSAMACEIGVITEGSRDFNFDKWLLAGCRDGSQYFAGTSQFVWKDESGRKVALLANGEIFDVSDEATPDSDDYILKIHSINMDSIGRKNFLSLLNESMGQHFRNIEKPPIDDAKLVRLLGTAIHSYELVLFFTNGKPIWGLICKSYCNNDNPVIFAIGD